jgi:mono/diheme cytochrome c family protein
MKNEQAWTALIAALVLLVAALSTWRLPTDRIAPPQGQSARGPVLEPHAVPLVSGEEPVQEQFIRAGCPVCHTIPGIAGAQGKVGPPLTLGTTGLDRLKTSNYSGRAQTVREYIIESIVAPQEYVVPGYPDRTMPTWYGTKLSAAALDQMAAYLEKITDMVPPQP